MPQKLGGAWCCRRWVDLGLEYGAIWSGCFPQSCTAWPGPATTVSASSSCPSSSRAFSHLHGSEPSPLGTRSRDSRTNQDSCDRHGRDRQKQCRRQVSEPGLPAAPLENVTKLLLFSVLQTLRVKQWASGGFAVCLTKAQDTWHGNNCPERTRSADKSV